jgi:hypothetical protein
MKNVERLAKYITKNGAESIIIHTIPGTSNWLICQKIETDKWVLTLGSPMGNVTYNLGITTTKEHLKLCEQLVRMEIEKKTSQAILANEFRNKIYNFKKNYENTYKNFIQVKEKNKSKIRKKPKRPKKTNF